MKKKALLLTLLENKIEWCKEIIIAYEKRKKHADDTEKIKINIMQNSVNSLLNKYKEAYEELKEKNIIDCNNDDCIKPFE